MSHIAKKGAVSSMIQYYSTATFFILSKLKLSGTEYDAKIIF